MEFEAFNNFLDDNSWFIHTYQNYDGFDGFYTYGINGLKLKNKIINLWKKEFIETDDAYEIETPLILPFEILDESGHLDQFNEFVIKDNDGNIKKAKDILKKYYSSIGKENISDQVDTWGRTRIEGEINKYKLIQPQIEKNNKKKQQNNVNKRVRVETKNLMYGIGATSQKNPNGIDFMRPELLQGFLTNFNSYKQEFKIPFIIGEIGKVLRKEIAPKPYLNMREFTQGELAIFFNPLDTSHKYFDIIKDYKLSILTKEKYKNDKKSITINMNELFGKINNKYMCYYFIRVYEFINKLGIDKDYIRIRELDRIELPHYSLQTWVFECLINNKWIKLVTINDRGAYDIETHSNRINITSTRKLQTPIKKVNYDININKPKIFDRYQSAINEISKYLLNLKSTEIKQLKGKLEKNNGSMYIYINNTMYIITSDMIEFLEINEEITEEVFTPNILTITCGIDRIIYSLLYHSIKFIEDKYVLEMPI